jgi:hypothetical protein
MAMVGGESGVGKEPSFRTGSPEDVSPQKGTDNLMTFLIYVLAGRDFGELSRGACTRYEGARPGSMGSGQTTGAKPSGQSASEPALGRRPEGLNFTFFTPFLSHKWFDFSAVRRFLGENFSGGRARRSFRTGNGREDAAFRKRAKASRNSAATRVNSDKPV